jgi:hypothetical protein
MREELGARASVGAADKDGLTPLHRAAAKAGGEEMSQGGGAGLVVALCKRRQTNLRTGSAQGDTR